MNKLKTIAITLGCAAVATAAIAVAGTKSLSMQQTQASEKIFRYDASVGDHWNDGGLYNNDPRNVATTFSTPIRTEVWGRAASNKGDFGGEQFFVTRNNMEETLPITFEAGLNNVTKFQCEFQVHFVQELAYYNLPSFDISIVATDGKNESRFDESVTSPEDMRNYSYTWTKTAEESAYVFKSIKMTLTMKIKKDATYRCYFHFAEVTWNC